MKKIGSVFIVVFVMVSFMSLAWAAESRKGTIKDVDTKAGTIIFCPEGTTSDMMLKAGKGVDLSKVKPDTKAEITVEKGTVKEIKEMKKPKAPVGC